MIELSSRGKTRILYGSLLIIVVCISLGGCATNALWHKSFSYIDSPIELAGNPQQIKVNYAKDQLCIEYEALDDLRERRYLIASYMGGHASNSIEQLDHLLSTDLHVKYNHSIIYHQALAPFNSPQLVRDEILFYFFYTIPKEHIAFEALDNAYYDKLLYDLHSNVVFDGVALIDQRWYYNWKKLMSADSEELTKEQIRRRWLERYGHNLTSSLYIVGWFDQDSKIVVPTTNNQNTRPIQMPDIRGVLFELVPPTNGIKYVKADFSIGAYVVKESSNDANIMIKSQYRGAKSPYFILPQVASATVKIYNKANCDSDEWKTILQSPMSIELLTQVRREHATYDHNLAARVAGTPFALALDAITFPVQLLLFSLSSP